MARRRQSPPPADPSSRPPPPPLQKSTGWLSGPRRRKIQSIAPVVYFLIVIFQVPLFRIQCRSGMCTTPLQVTAPQLIASGIFPTSIVKTLLYPGAIVDGLVTNMTLPAWTDLFDLYNLTNVKNASAVVDLHRLEVLAGSYFCVAGAITGIMNPGRMSMFGTLLVVWGLVKEGFLGKQPANTDPATSVYMYPTMLLALVCAVVSVKRKTKATAAASVRAQTRATPLESSAKSKLK